MVDKEEIETLKTRLAKWESINYYTFTHNPVDAIARSKGWLPLDEGQEMTVSYCGKRYTIVRNENEVNCPYGSSKLIQFYFDSGDPYKWSDIVNKWQWKDWEGNHDYIQWLFPNIEPSQLVAETPVLTDEDIHYFKKNKSLTQRLEVSFIKFCDFLGLELTLNTRPEGAKLSLTENPYYYHVHKQYLWNEFNHNWLRITRVLNCLETLGCHNLAQALFQYLKDSDIDFGQSMEYWKNAMQGDHND